VHHGVRGIRNDLGPRCLRGGGLLADLIERRRSSGRRPVTACRGTLRLVARAPRSAG
jgi:hypothetical protein